jgi:hypothetical protein
MSDAFARDKLNNWAGGCYLAANTAMLFKGVIDHAIETKDFELAKVMEDPVAAASGAFFVPAATIMLVSGHKNRNAMIAMGLNTIGNTILITNMIADSKMGSATVGVGFGLAAAAYATVKCAKNEFKDNEEQISQPDTGDAFFKTAKEITNKYPLLPTAAINLCSSVMIGLGALQTGDSSFFGIAVSWTIGSLFLSRAAPKVHKNQPLYKPA